MNAASMVQARVHTTVVAYHHRPLVRNPKAQRTVLNARGVIWSGERWRLRRTQGHNPPRHRPRNTVISGTREIATGVGPSDRVRAKGAGPKALIDTRPGLLEALDELVHPETRGTPISLLRWTSKSTAKLAWGTGPQQFPDLAGHSRSPVEADGVLVAGPPPSRKRAANTPIVTPSSTI